MNDTDFCPMCQFAECGDGHVHAGYEECDDGNTSVTDACPSGPTGSCRPAYCGDTFIRAGIEECDVGLNEPDGANPSCDNPATNCSGCICVVP